MKSMIFAVAAVALAAGSAMAQTYTINFDTDAAGNTIPSGTTISNQYAAWGATFVPNVLNPANGWASNTDMTATSTDVGGGYQASYGNVLHSFGGWLAEDGDPNFAILFAQPISDLTVRFTGDSTGFSEVDAFDAAGNLVGFGVVSGGDSTLKTVSLTGLSATSIGLVLPGTFGDWVGVVDVTYTVAVPTPAPLAMAGVGGLMVARRRRR